MSRPPPGTRADYATFHAIQTRWRDNDGYGHVNNATYLSYFDTALSYWQISQGIEIFGPDALRFVVVESGCRYHSEAAFPDRVHAGLRVGHLGNSSVRYEIGLFRNDEQTCCTEGFFAQVLTDPKGTPIPIPIRVRNRLSALLT